MAFDLFLLSVFSPELPSSHIKKGGCCPLALLQKTKLVLICSIFFRAEKSHENFAILLFSCIAYQSL